MKKAISILFMLCLLCGLTAFAEDSVEAQATFFAGMNDGVIQIPDNVIAFESEAFKGDKSITTVYIPASVTSIAADAFDETGLKYILYGGTEAQWKTVQASGLSGVAIRFSDGMQVPVTERFFPDATFRAYVASSFDTSQDAILSPEEIAAVSEIVVVDQNISSLTGLEYFPELTKLVCNGNNLTTLDVTQNEKLITLICGNGTNGQPTGNKLKTIDLSHNPKLEVLWCICNEIEALDLSHNTELREFSCFGNQLSSLDLSHNAKLQALLIGNQVNGTEYGNNISSLDLSHNPLLETLCCGYNGMTSLNIQNCSELMRLNCSRSSISKLDISHNVKLKSFDYWNAGNEGLTGIDLSNNPLLTYVNVSANSNLTSVTLGSHIYLSYLGVQNTAITSVDISGCPIISQVYQNGTRVEFYGNGNVAETGNGKFYGYKDGLNQGTSTEIAKCRFMHNKAVTVVNSPASTETISVGGKSYAATYCGRVDISQWHATYAERDFWRLEDAYEDFCDNALTGEWLPESNYPMSIEAGQVFVIDYYLKDGSGVDRRYMRSDSGDMFTEQNVTMQNTRAFIP